MKVSPVTTIILALVSLVIFSVSVFSEGADAPRKDPLTMMSETLEKAGCPLSEKQQSEIESIKPGIGAHKAIMDILDDEQKKSSS